MCAQDGECLGRGKHDKVKKDSANKPTAILGQGRGPQERGDGASWAEEIVTEKAKYNWDASQNWWDRNHPGISTYFEGRMTAIAVTTVGSSTSTGSGSTSATSTSTSASTLLTSNFLTTAQTARFGTGIYMPTFLERWRWNGADNALFIAPLAKVGFDSVTGSSTINVPAGTPGASATGTVTLEPLFNLGGRLGHMQLGRSFEQVPRDAELLGRHIWSV